MLNRGGSEVNLNRGIKKDYWNCDLAKKAFNCRNCKDGGEYAFFPDFTIRGWPHVKPIMALSATTININRHENPRSEAQGRATSSSSSFFFFLLLRKQWSFQDGNSAAALQRSVRALCGALCCGIRRGRNAGGCGRRLGRVLRLRDEED